GYRLGGVASASPRVVPAQACVNRPRTRTSPWPSAPGTARSTAQTNSVCVPAATSPWRAHSSQPSAPERRGGPVDGSVAIACHMPIGGTPRAKCSASSSCPAARSDTAHSPASRSSSCSAACRATEKPTSGGSSESPTSVTTVSPTRCPPESTVTTATPLGKRPSSERSSSPVSTEPHSPLRRRQLPQHVRQDPAVADVLALARRVESQSRAELLLVCANGHLARLAAGDPGHGEHLAPGEPERLAAL